MHDGVPTESEIRLEINSSKGNEMPLVAGQIIYLDELFVLNQLWFLMRLDDPTKEKNIILRPLQFYEKHLLFASRVLTFRKRNT